jgi:putative ABC transport system permease protein
VVPQDEITIPRYVTRPGERLHASYNAVSSGYFATMRIAVVAGREISESDSESAAPVALVNRAMAERFWPGASPLGRRFVRAGDKQHPLEIIGVVGNSRTEDLFSPYVPMFYIPVTQDDSPAQTLQVRTAGPPGAMAQEVLDIVRRLAPAAPVLSVRTMADAVNNGANGLFFFNLGAALTGVLGLLGLTLAVIGVYGVAASAVGHRTHEIGLRMALGARRVQIFWMLSRQGLTIVGLGMALGVLVAIAVGRLMGDFLMGVGPTDPLTYSIVSALLGVVALLACYVPVRRVLSGDPLVALRHE